MASPSDIRDVTLTSTFWTSMQTRSRDITIPAIIHAQKSLQHWYCLTWKEGHGIKPHPFWDSDIYKVTEAACYFLLKNDDPVLRQEVEHAVDMIRASQHEDGYLNSYYTVRGIKACVAYETLTNSRRLLEPVMKALRHVDSVFGPEEGKLHGYPGHQEIEIGLLRLYDLTKDPLTLKLAKYFILERGRKDENGEIFYDHESRARGGDPYDHMSAEMVNSYLHPRFYEYHQAHAPLVEQDEIKGHAVRAMYFVTAATELVRLTGDTQVKAALGRLWRSTVDKKMYITGGIGTIRQCEGFGPEYFLSDTEESQACYAETCATFALIVWCSKLLRQELKGEYADVMEIALYNGFLGAVGLDGKSFYYQNPLRTLTGRKKERSTWFEVACCPPNVAKLLAQLETLIYSYQQDLVAIHLWIASEFTIPESNGTVISQTTNLPWSGDIELKVNGPKAVKLALRIPDWAVSNYTCSVSGGELKDGYLYLPALTNTTINLTFPLQPRKVYANPRTDKDEICIMRGPMVYCIEDVDNPGVDIDHIALIDGPVADAPAATIAGVEDVVTVSSPGKELVNTNWSSLYGSEGWKYSESTKQLTFVPYFLRMNRGGNGGMRVWVKRI
ncbi:DUF1680 domain protein [Talaromyces stipitatus ATCC 10500]|uniref:DUF1680 domain protein n=1 Tax=Talaromyces stipitatus (strain ATCC 10500 / CBS 375.48 / QM 6759 / NRRL 1006) TaxID=441959 RepID=B8LWB6_TALSN|nr:DUF1680 domain protein [Talaromyces stipitatus ATCC 10500]EED24227.1 DUF1680 domain protein [Talaromyces stipitatus ATCC 10500]